MPLLILCGPQTHSIAGLGSALSRSNRRDRLRAAPPPSSPPARSAAVSRPSPANCSVGRNKPCPPSQGMVNPAGARGDGEESRKRKMKSEGRWPAIKPKKDLQINRLKGNDLFTVPNLFTASEAKAYIEAAEALGFTHQGSLGPAKGEAYRDNDRISVTDPDLAESIWESGLKRIFNDLKLQGKVAVGLNPNIRFYRYKVGQRFGRHIDESVNLGEGRRTQYTLLIYLNGSSGSKPTNSSGGNQDSSMHSLVGGETVFYDQRRVVAEVAPAEGMALLHLHGNRCMLHEARAVTKNVKYILRSDVAFA